MNKETYYTIGSREGFYISPTGPVGYIQMATWFTKLEDAQRTMKVKEYISKHWKIIKIQVLTNFVKEKKV